MRLSDLKPRVTGHWGAVYAALAPELTQNHRTHQPCPVCGGKDRFRLFKEWQDTGAAICNQCGTGDGFTWAMRIGHSDLRGAARAVAWALGLTPEGRPDARMPPRANTPQPVADPRQHERNMRRLNELLRRCKDLHTSAYGLAYLHARGLGELIDRADLPPYWRVYDCLPYWHDGQVTGAYPALIAPVTDPHGNVIAAHRTWITTTGTKAPVPKPRKLTPATRPEGLAGAAIRLYPLKGNALALTEGLETALAVRVARPELPVWACISATGLRSVQLPAKVRTVYVMADKDHNEVGQRAADDLAERLTDEGRIVHVCLPPGPIPAQTKGLDWLDVLNAEQRASA